MPVPATISVCGETSRPFGDFRNALWILWICRSKNNRWSSESQNFRIIQPFSGWWFGCHFWHFPRNIGNNYHPNWRSHIFQRGKPTTNQFYWRMHAVEKYPTIMASDGPWHINKSPTVSQRAGHAPVLLPFGETVPRGQSGAGNSPRYGQPGGGPTMKVPP